MKIAVFILAGLLLVALLAVIAPDLYDPEPRFDRIPTRVSTSPPPQQQYTIYLTSKQNSGVPLRKPETGFACSDKIYAVLEINHPDGGSRRHQLLVIWRNPSGEDEQRTPYRFRVSDGRARVWVWLKLNASRGTALLHFMNPSAGMADFIGMWQLDIRLDGKQIGKKQFKVLC